MAPIEPKEMKLYDNKEDCIVKYIYIEKWNWVDAMASEHYSGNPHEHSVYRSVYNTKTKQHRLVLNEQNKNAVLLKGLNNSDELEGFTSQAVEISKENLLYLNLQESEVDKITTWIESENKDLFEIPNPASVPILTLYNAVIKQQNEEEEEMESLLHVGAELINVNYDYFQILIEIGELLTESTLTDHDSNLEALSLGKDGMSLNIGDSLRALNQYSSPNRKTNLDREQLHQAIIGIVRELNRRNQLEIE